MNALRPLFPPSISPPLSVLPLRGQWFNPDALNKHLSPKSNQWEFLPILNLFFHLSLFLYRATSQNSCYKCFTVTFRLIQRSRDVLFFFASEVSRVERFLLCLILQGHWRFIPFSQNEHRKFCSIKKKQKSSIAATHSSTNILSIRIVIPLWDAPVSFSLCFSVC